MDEILSTFIVCIGIFVLMYSGIIGLSGLNSGEITANEYNNSGLPALSAIGLVISIFGLSLNKEFKKELFSSKKEFHIKHIKISKG